MRKHFNNRHGGADVWSHDVELLKAKTIRFESRGTLSKLGFVSANKPLLMASNNVAYNVAKSKKPQTTAEEVIKPCVLQMRKIVLEKETSKSLN